MSELDDLITTRVLLVRPDGTAALKRIPCRLEAWQALVEGPIEALALTPHCGCYINEEGKYTGQSYNVWADAVIRALLAQSGRQLMPDDYIVGPAVFCGAADSAGWDTDVPEDVVQLVRVALDADIEEEQ